VGDVIQRHAFSYRLLLAVGSSVTLGALIGLAAAWHGPQRAVLVIAVPVGLALVLRSVWYSFGAAIAVLSLLPFAVAPIGVGVSPTFLSLALLITLALVGAITLIDRRERLIVGMPQLLVLSVIGVSAFALLLGAGRGYSLQTLHDYGKFVLALLSFFLTVQIVRSVSDVRRVLLLLLCGAGAAGGLALLLYAGGPGFTHRVLARLVPYGYPGDRIVRFIEDNPALAMRAVGTGVDPNSFGGLMMVGFVLAAAQLIVRGRSVPIWASSSVLLVSGVALLLTYSRGAWIGALAGLGLVILLRRPVLMFPAIVIGAAGIAAGIGSGFVTRLWLGFTLQDPATRLRLAEYRNAWDIVRRHPWFGVGFGDAPTIDLQVGVSSVYLTVAERAGLVGLIVFLAAVGTVCWKGLSMSVAPTGTGTHDIALTFTAALVAVLTVGLVDHYFFNPQFPHMASLLWIIAGTIIAISLLDDTSVSRPGGVSSATKQSDVSIERRCLFGQERAWLVRTGGQ
jgi:polysaccharide biosynthesis protein PslJ